MRTFAWVPPPPFLSRVNFLKLNLTRHNALDNAINMGKVEMLTVPKVVPDEGKELGMRILISMAVGVMLIASAKADDLVLHQPANTNQLNALSSVVNAELQTMEKRIAELERKVAGMQHQITVLHAKKADKK